MRIQYKRARPWIPENRCFLSVLEQQFHKNYVPLNQNRNEFLRQTGFDNSSLRAGFNEY